MDNQQSVGRSHQLVKSLNSVLDVNFVQNLELESLPTGFGAFHSNQEIDSLISRIESQPVTKNDLTEIKADEEKFNIQANKVIHKFNQNSERILQVTMKQHSRVEAMRTDREDRIENEN
jgi:hypothetical protein